MDLTLPPAEVYLLLGSPAVDLELPVQAVALTCDDVLDASFTTPTLTDWSVVAENTVDAFGASAAKFSVVEINTAGSPCRVKLTLVAAGATQDYPTKFSSPEQNTPHDTGVVVFISDVSDRGLTYDLYWQWISGSMSGGPTLVASAAVYIPINGEGDFPASG